MSDVYNINCYIDKNIIPTGYVKQIKRSIKEEICESHKKIKYYADKKCFSFYIFESSDTIDCKTIKDKVISILSEYNIKSCKMCIVTEQGWTVDFQISIDLYTAGQIIKKLGYNSFDVKDFGTYYDAFLVAEKLSRRG